MAFLAGAVNIITGDGAMAGAHGPSCIPAWIRSPFYRVNRGRQDHRAPRPMKRVTLELAAAPVTVKGRMSISMKWHAAPCRNFREIPAGLKIAGSRLRRAPPGIDQLIEGLVGGGVNRSGDRARRRRKGVHGAASSSREQMTG